MTASQRDTLLIETHGLVKELRVVVIGANGGGHEKRINDLEGDEKTVVTRLADIEHNMVSAAKCEAVQAMMKARGRSRWIVAKDVVLIVLPTATLITKLVGIW